jgi:predicted CXXCH cytochrome family protein
MRKLFITLLAVAVVVMLVPSVSMALDGPHDTSLPGSNNCSNCHTPHNGNGTVTDAPLWGHTVTGETFTMYSVNSPFTIAGSPQGTSLLCLSCHDGVTAVAGGSAMTGGNVIGTVLDNDHPISVTYAATATDFVALTTVQGSSNVELYGGSNNQLECATCHQAHDVNAVTDLKYLRSNKSALCGTCHTK